MTLKNAKTLSAVEQARHVRQLIDFAKKRDDLGGAGPTRHQLVAALQVLGRDKAEAERIVDAARRRVRKAANMAEATLENLFRHEKLWDWTHPRDAIRQMRSRNFGAFDKAPLTDIEQAMVDKGNVLMIIAMYDVLKWPILARLRSGSGAPDESGDGVSAEAPQKHSESH